MSSAAVVAMEPLAWIKDKQEKKDAEVLLSACWNDDGVQSDGHISVEKAKLFEDNFSEHRRNGSIKWIEFSVGDGDEKRPYVIPSKESGMYFNGGPMDPCHGVLPANLADNVRYSSAAREYNRCLYLSLGLAMGMHPFLLMILIRFTIHFMLVNGPFWHGANAAFLGGDSFQEVAETVMNKSVQTDAECLTYAVDMFHELFKDTTIVIVSVDSGSKATLTLINDDAAVAHDGVDDRNTVVLFLQGGHYTSHPGDREARQNFLADMKLHMSPYISTPDGINPEHRVSSQSLFRRWINKAAPTPPVSPGGGPPSDTLLVEFLMRNPLPQNIIPDKNPLADPVIDALDTSQQKHNILVRNICNHGTELPTFLTQINNNDCPLLRQQLQLETARTNASFAIHVAAAGDSLSWARPSSSETLLQEATLRYDLSAYAIHKALGNSSPSPDELAEPSRNAAPQLPGLIHTRVLVFTYTTSADEDSLLWSVTRIHTGHDDGQETSLVLLIYSSNLKQYALLELEARPSKLLWEIPLGTVRPPTLPPAPPRPPLRPPPALVVVRDDTNFETDFQIDPNWRGTREESQALAFERFRANGLGCSVIRSRSTKSREDAEATLINFVVACSRAGKFKSKAKEGIRVTSTKSTGCKSQISFIVCEDGLFKIKSSCGKHNHERCLSLNGFTQYTRPDDEDMLTIRHETSMGNGPVRILTTLLLQNPDTLVSVAQIKQTKRSIMKIRLGARTPIRAFVDQLRGVAPGGNEDANGDYDDDDGGYDKYGESPPVGDDDDDDDDDGGSGRTFYSSKFILKGDYYYALYIDQATGEIKRVAIFHKSSVELARKYPWILLMDSTFNVLNISGSRCLNLAGRTACGRYFIIGVGLMKGTEVSEVEFKWQLRALKNLVYEDQFPVVIIGDRELAMVNAILAVFGALAVFILCLWHVDKAVEGAASKAFPDDDVKLEEFTRCWKELRESKTVDLYEQRLQSVGDTYPSMIGYLETEWLNHHSESIVDCHVNDSRHFGIRWSSPVEKQNHMLKFFGNHRPGNHLKFLDDFTRLSVVQYQRLTSELAKQSQRTPTGALHHLELFVNLQNLVSEKALLHLCDQLELFMASEDDDGDDLRPCTGFTNRCFGLPCAHDIQRCFETATPISIHDVHASWYLDPTRAHRDKKSRMEAELREPEAMAQRKSATGRRSDAVTVGLGRRESSHETIDRLRKKANQLVVKQLQTNLRNADIENKRLEQEQKRKESEEKQLAAAQKKQMAKEATATAKKLASVAKKTAREEEKSLLSKNKKKKCERCSKFEVGWVYCDGGLGCSVDISDVDDRWHKLCCVGLKSVPTAETWHCVLCL